MNNLPKVGQHLLPFAQLCPKYSCLQMCLTSVAWANVEAGIYHLNDERRFLFIGITTKNHLTNVSNH